MPNSDPNIIFREQLKIWVTREGDLLSLRANSFVTL